MESNNKTELLQYYRDTADQYASKMKNCFENSQKEFKTGDKGKAKKLSDEGKSYKEKLDELNSKVKALQLEIKNDNSKNNQKYLENLKNTHQNNQNILTKYTSSTNDEELSEEEKLSLQYRNKASQYALNMKDCFDKSQNAFQSGNKALAKSLAEEGKNYKEKLVECNLKAKNIIFKYKNKERGLDEIDLHGLLVEEAMEELKNRIELLKSKEIPSLIVVHGKGIHSDSNNAKIKPACIALVEKEGLQYIKDSPNEGCLTINFILTNMFV